MNADRIWAVRAEKAGDEAAIRALTLRAFDGHPFSNGDEADVIERLRKDGDLALSLVAQQDGAIIGHAAWSAARLSNGEDGWMVLGPISVDPLHQRKGVGRALIAAGEAAMMAQGVKGITVLGDPAIYRKFGFVQHTAMRLEGELGAYLQVKSFGAAIPSAEITYAAAFG